MKLANMAPVSVTDLIAGRPNLADIYVKISDNNYVLIYHKGEVLTENKLSHYKVTEKVNEYWVAQDNLHQFTIRNITLAGAALKSSDISSKQKAKLTMMAIESLFSEFQYLGFNEHNFLRAKAANELILKLVTNKNSLRNLLIALHEIQNDVLKKSVATSAVAVMMAQQLGYSLPETLQSISLGALFRDVGLTQLPRELSEKHIDDLTMPERMKYITHPTVGKTLLQKINGLPSEIIDIVHQHEELPDGTGFPRNIKKMELHPFSEIVILAGLFTDLTIKTKQSPNPLAIMRAAEEIATTEIPFSRKVLRALIQITRVFQ